MTAAYGVHAVYNRPDRGAIVALVCDVDARCTVLAIEGVGLSVAPLRPFVAGHHDVYICRGSVVTSRKKGPSLLQLAQGRERAEPSGSRRPVHECAANRPRPGAIEGGTQ